MVGIIFNPASGRTSARASLDAMLSALKHRGTPFTVCTTEHAKHASELAQGFRAKDVHKIIAFGGDGTLHEVLNGFGVHQDCGHPLLKVALIPGGTGNSFLRDFPEQTLETRLSRLLDDNLSTCDAGLLTTVEGQKIFGNILSFGFVANVAHHRNAKHASSGELGYTLSVLHQLKNLRSAPMIFDVNGVRHAEPYTFLSINNSKFTGGSMKMAPNASLQDGCLDLIEVGSMSRWALLRAFPKIFSGHHVDLPQINASTFEKLSFVDADLCPIMIDGEVDRCQPKVVECLPSCFEVAA